MEDRLKRYAEPPAGFRAAELLSDLAPLTSSCAAYKSSDDSKIRHGIDELERWIEIAAPKVASAYPHLPMHEEVLRSIPQNLRASLALCREVGSANNGQRDWSKYKKTRDLLASEYALALKAIAPQQKLVVWAHVSHLFYDSNGKNTSVGELLHRELGNRLYTVGVFALGGGTVALFSDVNEDFGYTPIYGTSSAILTFLAKGCLDTCFVNLKNIRPSSPLTQSQDVWIESRTQSIHLASEFDGVVWVRHIHPPRLQLRLPLLLFIFFKHYLKPAASVLGTAGFLLLLWITFRRRSHLRKPQGLQP